MSTFNLINKTHYSGFYNVPISELNTVLSTAVSAGQEMLGACAAPPRGHLPQVAIEHVTVAREGRSRTAY